MAYKVTKTSAHDRRDVMPDCVLRVSSTEMMPTSQCKYDHYTFLQEVRERFPNPAGVPYTDFKSSTSFIV